MPDTEAAVDRMAVLLAHAILEHGGEEIDGEEPGAPAAAGAHLIKIADGRRA